MTREQKIWRLNKHCSRHKCNQEECRIYPECSDSAGELLETLDDTEIDKMYNKLFSTQITENLTGVVKEEPKTITEFFDDIKSSICDNYCKYPSEIKDCDELIETVCSKCPLRKLN